MTKPSFNVCFVISEAEPLIKVGGLGDVGGTLPAALVNLPPEMTDGRPIDVRVVIPYHDILKEKQIPSNGSVTIRSRTKTDFSRMYMFPRPKGCPSRSI